MQVGKLVLIGMGSYLVARSFGLGLKPIEELASGEKLDSSNIIVKDKNHKGVDLPMLFGGTAMIINSNKV